LGAGLLDRGRGLFAGDAHSRSRREARARIRGPVFATDIDHESIDKARPRLSGQHRRGRSPDRLARFFTHEESDFYRIKKTLRDQLIFAEQDVIKDPPFSKLDLISCRNLLIYMEPVLQSG